MIINLNLLFTKRAFWTPFQPFLNAFLMKHVVSAIDRISYPTLFSLFHTWILLECLAADAAFVRLFLEFMFFYFNGLLVLWVMSHFLFFFYGCSISGWKNKNWVWILLIIFFYDFILFILMLHHSFWSSFDCFQCYSVLFFKFNSLLS